MKAIVVSRHGGPEVLELVDVPDPQPGPGEVVVTVRAIGVNFMEVAQREGTPPFAGLAPFRPGTEGAGTVVAIGADVHDTAVGDRVAWWVPGSGSYAERVILPADRVVPVPAGIDFETAAAVFVQGLTAHYLATETFPVAPGDVAVVHSGAGGVGLLLTQFVKRRGGLVVATASTTVKRAKARAAGADIATDYDGFGVAAAELSGSLGAAVVYDGVGSPTFEAGLAALRPRGLMVLYGSSGGRVAPFDLQRLHAYGSLYVTHPGLRSHVATREQLRARAAAVFDLVGRGELDVHLAGRYPLSAAGSAQNQLVDRLTVGKLVLVPD